MRPCRTPPPPPNRGSGWIGVLRYTVHINTIPSKVSIDATPNRADNLTAVSFSLKLDRYQVDTPDIATSIKMISDPSGKLAMSLIAVI
tara:strand:+ start:2705 stop:2968 length:264 start_codon:yes stop_codon:yes gene_type:complete